MSFAAVELLFDEVSDARIRRLWGLLDDAGVPSLQAAPDAAYVPHVSLAVVSVADEGKLQSFASELDILSRRFSLPDFTLSFLGVFSSVDPSWSRTPDAVVFAGVSPSPVLLRLHTALYDVVEAFEVSHWPLYEPGSWVPHATLASGVTDVPKALTTLIPTFSPIQVSPVSLRLVDTASGELFPI